MNDDVSDRELLELAAKAGGVGLLHWNSGGEPYSSGEGFILTDNRIWNPLVSDGDSRYLEVTLDLTVTQDGGMACVWALDGVDKSGEARIFEHYEPYINHAGDKLAATRFAVFSVAVEIGKAMP